MLIQKQDDYEWRVAFSWLSPEQMQLKITTTISGTTHNHSYFLTPEEAGRIADHINDVLCR